METEGPTPRAPGQRLLTAILLRAIRDYVNYKDAKPGTEQYDIAADATGWVFWEGEEGMTFRYVCKLLEIDPEKTRKTMLALTREDLLRMTPPEEESVSEPDEDEG